MKVRIVNKHGHAWDFANATAARPHIRKSIRDDYRIEAINGEKVRVYRDQK